jgi:hypothetical protein
VIHQIWVEKPNSTTRRNRSTRLRTFARPANHQARPTVAAASAALIPVSHWSAICGPVIATSGISAIAGKGANGTKMCPSRRITSCGPRRTSSQVRPCRNASAR